MKQGRSTALTLAAALAGTLALSACGGSNPTEPPGDNGGGGPYSKIETWAGTGVNGAAADGTALKNADLSTPMDVAFSPEGDAYIVDWNNHRILKVTNDRVYIVIGNGTLGVGAEGPVLDDPNTPELEAGLNHPTNVNFDSKGRIIMAAWHNSKIMRCDLVSGRMYRLAGLESADANGNRCWNGDTDEDGNPRPGIEACLDLPVCTAWDSQGNLYIADQKNLRIRRLNPVNGEITSTQSAGELSTIETIVGTGNSGPEQIGSYNGNGRLGPDTDLSAPGGQAAPPSSRILIRGDVIYFCDSANNMVRKFDTDGRVHLVAGNEDDLDNEGKPVEGYDGDGGPATKAHLFFPTDIAFDSEGNLYIADCYNHVIRKVDTNGIITTFAGQGYNPDPDASVGDGGPPTKAWLNRPYGLAIDADDNIYITDTHHNRIRIVRK